MNNQRMIDRGMASICFDVSVLGISNLPLIYYEFFYHKGKNTCFLYIKDEFSQYYYLEEYFNKSKKISLSTYSLLNENPEIAREIKKVLNNDKTKTNGLFSW